MNVWFRRLVVAGVLGLFVGLSQRAGGGDWRAVATWFGLEVCVMLVVQVAMDRARL